MSKRVKRLLILLDLLLVIGLILAIFFYQKRADNRETVDAVQLERRYVQTISHEGEDYPVRRYLSSLLLIGTDNFIDDAKQNEIEAFYNDNLADFLVLLVFDHSRKTVTPVQICRDTMCEVPWLSVNGKVGGTVFEQITLSHSFGTGKEDSCVNTRNTVSSLLYDIPIDNYLSFTMETVPLLNDLVGGVTVTLEDDIPALGPEYVKGATITLKGNNALRFVRSRDISQVDSNLARMGHHRLYLSAFTLAAREALGGDPDFAEKAFKAAEKFLCTDLSVENMSDIANELCEYEILPVLTPSGEYVMGEEFAEYYMDDASLWECVKTAFCD